MADQILRLPAVKQRTGLSRSTIYLRISEGTFPPSVKLGGPRAVGWLDSDIEGWLSTQVEQSRKADEIRWKRIVALRGDPAPQPK